MNEPLQAFNMEIKPYPAEECLTELGSYYPFSSFIFGQFGRLDITKYTIDALNKHGIKVSPKRAFFYFTLLNHQVLGEKILDKINSFGCYHDNFGEGFNDERDKSGDTFKSYAFQLPDNSLIHVGFDHRGTVIYFPKDTKEENLIGVLQWLVDVCIENDKELCLKYFKMQ